VKGKTPKGVIYRENIYERGFSKMGIRIGKYICRGGGLV
jgi:hypothetical protein